MKNIVLGLNDVIFKLAMFLNVCDLTIKQNKTMKKSRAIQYYTTQNVNMGFFKVVEIRA